VNRAAAFVAVLGTAALSACGAANGWAQQATTKIEIAKNKVGAAPADFEFARTGDGDLGQWSVVRDPTAVDGFAIEHISTDQHDDRFPLAIYKPLVLENLAAVVRFKIIAGTMKAAGLAVCLRNPDSYYVVSASALEHRVDLFLFANGKKDRIESAEADVEPDRWQTLSVIVNDDHFTVSLDAKELFTTFDRTRMKDGRIALWTQEDNVTRFDQIEIQPLPRPE
jgi:hypothetical protein